jgi:hypothetical protein
MQLEDAKARFLGPRPIANYSLVHHLAAKEFARQARIVEDANLHEKEIGKFWDDIRMYTTATILTSTAALEAFVNECFLLPNGALRNQLGDDFDAQFWGRPTLWLRFLKLIRCRRDDRSGIEGLNTLRKYDKALKLMREPKLKKVAGTTVKHAEALIELRNMLIHFKPLHDGPQDDDRKLKNKLHACGFPLSPYHDANSDFVLQCMTAGCAAWAVQTTANLVVAFAYQIRVNTNVADDFK